MKQIGGAKSALFALNPAEFRRLQDRVRDDPSFEPHAIFPEGPAGALAGFRSFDDAMLAKLAIV